ncbi:MAG: diguanylate cyclase domain-containing protein [Thiobacillus sp.]
MQRNFLIVAGGAFITLLILIIVLAVSSILQLNDHRKLNADVLIQNRKVGFVTEIQVASHMRTDSLLRMALTKDPFIRDEILLEFNRAGVLVGIARKDLQKMLTLEERPAFDRETSLVTQIHVVQNQIADLLMAERTDNANALLRQIAIPLQAQFNLQLAQLRGQFQNETLQAQTLASERFSRTWNQAVLLSIAAVLMGVIVGWLTLNQLWKISRQIEFQFAELERSRAALKQEATHDSLTGLANRRLFYDRLQQAIRQARRYQSKVGLLFLDLNRFKEINDTHGHHVGDAVLTEVARRLAQSVRESDSIARLGGDEFVVLLDKVNGRDDCLSAAIKIERALAEDSSFYGLAIDITASIGQALFPDDGDNEDSLIRAADAAMYRIKTGAAAERQGQLAFHN